MDRVYKGVKYESHNDVPVITWARQGSEYDSPTDAKYAAAKLWASCNNNGVNVKRLSNGKFGLFFWR